MNGCGQTTVLEMLSEAMSRSRSTKRFSNRGLQNQPRDEFDHHRTFSGWQEGQDPFQEHRYGWIYHDWQLQDIGPFK